MSQGRVICFPHFFRAQTLAVGACSPVDACAMQRLQQQLDGARASYVQSKGCFAFADGAAAGTRPAAATCPPAAPYRGNKITVHQAFWGCERELRASACLERERVGAVLPVLSATAATLSDAHLQVVLKLERDVHVGR